MRMKERLTGLKWPEVKRFVLENYHIVALIGLICLIGLALTS